MFGKTIVTDSIKLREDDVLTCYTDGITEAMNPNRELFSDEAVFGYNTQTCQMSVKGVR